MKLLPLLLLFTLFTTSSTSFHSAPSESIVKEVEISGIILDKETGGSIPAANVFIQKLNKSTASDINGKFSLKVPVGKHTLEVTYVGFKNISKEIEVGPEGLSGIIIELETMVLALEEVVVSGYGAEVDRAVTGNVSSVQVQGKAAGVPIYSYPANEEYSPISENLYKWAQKTPLSTFSIDVDAASYSNIRRMIMNGYLPPVDAVRIEEMINYFNYEYQEPESDIPFSVNTEVASAPWNPEHRIVQIGIQGQHIDAEDLPPSNLVFLLDVSGSMSSYDKLPLLKNGFKLLVNQLREEDYVSIVVYAGSSGLVLPPTSGADKEKILESLNKLNAGGSTAGAAGIEQAYAVAMENFNPEANNRVILATDGDFNVGISSEKELVKLIEEKREAGVFLSVLGFGTGNLKDSRMEQIADKGNGNYYYIDNLLEARKVLVSEMGGTLHTIAKDVKIQVEFNPANVRAYRLIGYENRLLADEDFNDDTKDAGELGAGHTVTALYEVIPTGVEIDKELLDVDPLKYQTPSDPVTGFEDELMTVKLRYKQPDGDQSRLISTVIRTNELRPEMSRDLSFASAVAAFGMILRDSKFKGSSDYAMVQELARKGKGDDSNGYRSEFIKMVELSELISQGQSSK